MDPSCAGTRLIVSDQVARSMVDAAPALAAVAAAYALGCFCAGYYLVRWRTGRDVRLTGSGGAGARNAGRLLGRGAFGLVLALDALKGALAVAVAAGLGVDGLALGAAALAVVVGHVLPAQLGFRGGKGIAPSIGALVVYSPTILLAPAAMFAVAYVLSRGRIIPSGLAAYGLSPVAAIVLGQSVADILVLSAVAAVVLMAHQRHLRDAFGSAAPAS